MVPSRVVVLGLEADDSCGEKCKSCGERAVKLRLEWDDNFGMSWNFRVLDDFGLDRTWTCGTQFVWFSVSCHEFCMSFHFCCMTCLWVLRAETTVICFAVLWRVVHALAVGFGLSLRFTTSLHYFCFGLRHWSLIDHILPVKMCGTHLGVVLSVIFVGSAIHLLRCESRTLGWTRESLCLAWHEMAEMWSAWSWEGLSSWIADYAQAVFGPRLIPAGASGLV